MVDDIYARTIKMFGSRPEPAFETAAELKAVWGREWINRWCRIRQSQKPAQFHNKLLELIMVWPVTGIFV